MSDKWHAVIVDLDGTLSDCRPRRKFIEGKKKDWIGFYEAAKDDLPNEWCKSLVQQLRFRYAIILVSGRPENYREASEKWLKENGIHYHSLLMRKEGDYRADFIIKEEIYREHIEPTFNIVFAVDDRKQVTDMWRKIGLVCLQCDEGNF